ncbi:uncharacterized protein FIESC28_08516 [Fusarium coffeatum]|uniref:Uncharacterized protein n=1 Tax=Fusarium coffeatum TaxID=231269 RepID=A0A366R6P5_9HYPO|nr:uncharacterized protein FIESC28_08516 [Fusarium coffeatum]RBR12814.1 hypothetical protein FIESC28_08516 [Fusarium coffeatum]
MSSSETETPTTTTAGDITTTTEAATTSSAASICTPPEGTVCGRQGYRTTNSGQLGQGSAGTLDESCEMWSEIPGFDDSETSFKWYQPACLCLDDAAPTN